MLLTCFEKSNHLKANPIMHITAQEK